MSKPHALTLRLERQDFLRLEAEAKRLGVRPGTLAKMVLHQHLEHPRRSPAEALERLRSLRTGLPEADAVTVVRAGRDELEHRQAP
jgi:hypothetical protein